MTEKIYGSWKTGSVTSKSFKVLGRTGRTDVGGRLQYLQLEGEKGQTGSRGGATFFQWCAQKLESRFQMDGKSERLRRTGTKEEGFKKVKKK